MTITGKYLISRGFKEGKRIGAILKEFGSLFEDFPICDDWGKVELILEKHRAQQDLEDAQKLQTIPMLNINQTVQPFFNIVVIDPIEEENVEKVKLTIEEMVRVPTVVGAAVFPDACPSGNSAPVGTVFGAKNAIHPSWHSADICCSMFATNFGKRDPKLVMDQAFDVTHFGRGGRPREDEIPLPDPLMELLKHHTEDNHFFNDQKLQYCIRSHFATQGDGNHFLFVGQSQKTGDTWMVTHHGSRGFGARLYKSAMKIAETHRQRICPDVPKIHAWIPFDSDDGLNYFRALEYLSSWTQASHQAIHSLVSKPLRIKVRDQYWNPHNHVFMEKKSDGIPIFWHAKGATPVDQKFMHDTKGVQIIPLSMADPILLVTGTTTNTNHGFAPHGAGRNMSRTQHRKSKAGQTIEEILAEETAGLDIRFFGGDPDITELPSAYKCADTVESQIKRFNLATIVDKIQPYGSIMCGHQDWSRRR